MDKIADKNYVLAHLKLYETHANKQWSQNFLVDDNLAGKIVKALEITPQDTIVEIGSGLGALTYHLVKTSNRIIAAEIDPLMVTHLREQFSGTNLEIFPRDFLCFDFSRLNKPVKVIGNLPYYITSDILEKLLLNHEDITRMVLMVQKEAYLRMTAPMNTKDYGPLSLLIQLLGRVEVITQVSRHAYFPEPHVDSLVFACTIDKKCDDIDARNFWSIVKRLFAMRRKTILNNLTRIIQDKNHAMAILDELKMPHNTRPENADLDFYIRLTRCLRN